MTFASRELTRLSQWEVGIGIVAGGGPMARLPRLIGRAERRLGFYLDRVVADPGVLLGYVRRDEIAVERTGNPRIRLRVRKRWQALLRSCSATRGRAVKS